MSGRSLVLMGLVLVVVLAAGPASGASATGGGYRLVPNPAGEATPAAISSGGAYRLLGSTVLNATTAVAGGGYRLLAAAPAGHGTPCCCAYLPCLVNRR